MPNTYIVADFTVDVDENTWVASLVRSRKRDAGRHRSRPTLYGNLIAGYVELCASRAAGGVKRYNLGAEKVVASKKHMLA